MLKKLTHIDNILYIIGSLALFLIAWELLTVVMDIAPYLLPKPSMIFQSAYDNRELLFFHSKYTLYESVVGLVASLLFAVVLAIILDLSTHLQKIVYPWLILSQTIPLTAIAPLFIIWFGFSSSSKILVVLLVCFFPLVINILTGFKEVDQELIDLMKVMKATKVQIYAKVKIPHAFPYLLSGLKISTTYAVLAAVISEYMGGRSGLGIYMSRAISSYNISALFAIIFVIMILSILLIFSVQILEKYMIKWK